MLRFIKYTLTLGAILIGLSLASMSFAFGDNCKDVRILVKNNRAQEIKVTKVKYYDYDQGANGTWRSESGWGTLKIAPGLSGYKYKTRDLEYVKNDLTKVKIYWKYNTGGSSWSSEYTKTSSDFICNEGDDVYFTVN